MVPQGLWEVMQEWSITLWALQSSLGAHEGTGEV